MPYKNYYSVIAWKHRNREKINLQARLRHQLKRQGILAELGGKCDCCAEVDWQLLTVDHLLGNGTSQRLEQGVRRAFESLIISNKARLLCHNCNMSLGIYRYCPHIDKSKFPIILPSISEVGSKKLWVPYYKQYRQFTLRKIAFEHYGDICNLCGEWRYEFLAIDHINGGGRANRKTNLYEYLRRSNYPEGFRTLCHNCNSREGYYGR